jgi:hypothetical protein
VDALPDSGHVGSILKVRSSIRPLV